MTPTTRANQRMRARRALQPLRVTDVPSAVQVPRWVHATDALPCDKCGTCLACIRRAHGKPARPPTIIRKSKTGIYTLSSLR